MGRGSKVLVTRAAAEEAEARRHETNQDLDPFPFDKKWC